MDHEPLISIIIPSVNEADTLGPTLASARSARVPSEIILVDGTSTDETVAIARASGARIVPTSRRQRASQLNLGAQHARAETFLFLHADTVLPALASDAIARSLRAPEVVGGAFARRYASASPVLRATCFLAHLRNQLIGWHLGDQAMFVRRKVFFQLGGFREVDQFEDLDFSRRLKGVGRIVTLIPAVTSSSRRFSRGTVRTTSRDLALTIRYLIEGLPAPQPAAALRQTVPT